MLEQTLQNALAEILPKHAKGITEFDLLSILQCSPYHLFDSNSLSDPLIMFQTHFVLFNALYCLRDKWLAEQYVCLDMVLTKISLIPYQEGKIGVAKVDPLRSYYLNWNNFSETSKEDVNLLLDSFWQQVNGLKTKNSIKPINVEKAYETMGLKNNSDYNQVKLQYRKLLHQHHPDKGGDNVTAQAIEQSYRLLRTYLT